MLDYSDEAIFLYVQMVVKGILPDKFTFPFLLSACSKVLAFYEGVQLHGALVKMGLMEDAFIENSLIHFYVECEKLDYSQRCSMEWLRLISN
ncbi:hypothetical protein L3X38_032189 [Prunus dulcis]|uniref:Pentatricopeptide repeat-containing protein n=1 Tax=Prunus dulcis TaxID=3755 RepID=A0AAD4VFU7_PRUDU|nr:hypothetical protein L3X38_032189 [Prunus dulcis]